VLEQGPHVDPRGLRVRLYGDAETFDVNDAVQVWPDESKAIIVRGAGETSAELVAPVSVLDE